MQRPILKSACRACQRCGHTTVQPKKMLTITNTASAAVGGASAAPVTWCIGFGRVKLASSHKKQQ